MSTPGTKEYFDRVAVPFSRNYARDAAFLERKTIWERAVRENLSRLADDALCLDMGCGDGTLGRMVAARGFKTIGFDQSGQMLALARQRSQAAGLTTRTDYIEASLPLPQPMMDRYRGGAGLILCSSVLEYIDAYEDVLTQFAQLLRPGGRLIVSVPNEHSLYRLGARLFGRMLAPADSYLRYQRHRFYPQEFKASLSRLGYLPVREEYFSLPFQAHSRRLLGAHRGKRTATLYLLVAERT